MWENWRCDGGVSDSSSPHTGRQIESNLNYILFHTTPSSHLEYYCLQPGVSSSIHRYLNETKESFAQQWNEIQERKGGRHDLIILVLTSPPTAPSDSASTGLQTRRSQRSTHRILP